MRSYVGLILVGAGLLLLAIGLLITVAPMGIALWDILRSTAPRPDDLANGIAVGRGYAPVGLVAAGAGIAMLLLGLAGSVIGWLLDRRS
jgi:hypothetical protein